MNAIAAIQAALVAALKTVPGVDASRVYDNRTRALDASTTTAIRVLRDSSTTDTTQLPGPTQRLTAFDIELYARGGNASDVLDEMLSHVFTLLEAVDLYPQGVVQQSVVSIVFDGDETASLMNGATLKFHVLHVTKPHSLLPWD